MLINDAEINTERKFTELWLAGGTLDRILSDFGQGQVGYFSVGSTGTPSATFQVPLEQPTGWSQFGFAFEPGYQLAIQLSSEIRELLEELKELRTELSGRPLVSTILLSNLSDVRVTVVNPISVIVEEYDEECLARWPEVNAYGMGSTLSEAIHHLKDDIVELYYDLASRDEGILGDIADETLRALRSYIRERE